MKVACGSMQRFELKKKKCKTIETQVFYLHTHTHCCSQIPICNEGTKWHKWKEKMANEACVLRYVAAIDMWPVDAYSKKTHLTLTLELTCIYFSCAFSLSLSPSLISVSLSLFSFASYMCWFIFLDVLVCVMVVVNALTHRERTRRKHIVTKNIFCWDTPSVQSVSLVIRRETIFRFRKIWNQYLLSANNDKRWECNHNMLRSLIYRTLITKSNRNLNLVTVAEDFNLNALIYS